MLNATVLERIEVTESLVIFRIGCDNSIPDFLPGQYVVLGLFPEAPRPQDFPAEAELHKAGKLIKRSYSVASPPSEKRYLEFYIAILREGVLTPRFKLLQPGDRVHIGHKIVGAFTLEDTPADANLVFVATGTGIAPFMSMLRDPATWTQGRKVTLIHGVRFAADFAYQEELLEMQKTKPLKYLRTVSRDGAWSGDRGYVQDYFKNGSVSINPDWEHVFLCGNPEMIQAMEELLPPFGYKVHSRKTAGNLHLEKYW